MSVAEKFEIIADEVYNKGYEKGKAEGGDSNAFWDVYQDYGNRKGYQTAFFGPGWTDETYNPKYPITVGQSSGAIFSQSLITDTKVDIIFESTAYSAATVFQSATPIKTIKKLDITDYKYTYTNWFTGLPNLIDITIVGNFKNDVGFPSSHLLPKDMILHICEHLEDYSGTATTHTLTLHANAKAQLSQAEIAENITLKGWTLAQ